MSSGFVTENEVAEQRRVRQAEWERVRTDDQPLEAPEEVYDSRPLYMRLEEQKQKKDAEYEETHRLKNMIRTLDDDEVGFLELVERTKATAARQISLEEQREMQEFRERVSSLQETAESRRLAQQLAEPAPRRPAAAVASTRAKLQGVIVRKRKISDADPQENGAKNGLTKATKLESEAEKATKLDSETVKTSKVDSEAEKAGKVDSEAEKASKVDSEAGKKSTTVDAGKNGAVQVNGTSSSVSGAMKCVAVLPGLGHYDDDTTDSDNSSDSEDCTPRKSAYDLCGRRSEGKKKEESRS